MILVAWWINTTKRTMSLHIYGMSDENTITGMADGEKILESLC
jgi:hypothetical protein